MKTHFLTVERLREVLAYDPETGIFTHLRRRVGIGKVAGSPNGKGYINIAIDGVLYPAHRLAWMYVTGAMPLGHLDHKDLDRANNRFGNLRECSRSQNGANAPLSKANRSGFKGVCWFEQTGKWRAVIKYNRKQVHLGYYNCPVAAHIAYQIAADRHHGEFARAA